MYDSKLKGRIIAAIVSTVILSAMWHWMKGDTPDQTSENEAMSRARMMQMQYEHARQMQDMARTQMSSEQFMQSLQQMNVDYNY